MREIPETSSGMEGLTHSFTVSVEVGAKEAPTFTLDGIEFTLAFILLLP